jgi:hypothetical protein
VGLHRANFPCQFKDRFLLANIEYEDQLDHHFVFVDNSSIVYATKDDVGENTPSQPNSSFKDKSADECWLLLRAMHEAGSPQWSYVFDHALIEDHIMQTLCLWQRRRLRANDPG